MRRVIKRFNKAIVLNGLASGLDPAVPAEGMAGAMEISRAARRRGGRLIWDAV
ncbi:MAG: hypothetical protein M1343_06915 [Chloroflexi bacterium]|nr:hypothetical protein [Chloroflexota bacterium]MDA8189769.1 hypothetical protein [Dehalococcoidales bacterium]